MISILVCCIVRGQHVEDAVVFAKDAGDERIGLALHGLAEKGLMFLRFRRYSH